MSASDTEEKTEEPTANKLREAHKRGEVAASRDLTGAAGFAAVFLLLWLGGGFIERQMRRVFDVALDAAADGARSPHVEPAIVQMLVAMLWVLLPLLLLAGAVALLVGLMQTQGVLSTEPIKLRFDRLNPTQALKMLFSTQQLGVLLQLVFKVGFLAALLWWTFGEFLQPLLLGVYGGTANSGLATISALQTLFGATALVLLVLGTIDFVHSLFEYMKRNRMSKTERKHEQKDTDGDPLMKSERRRLYRQLLEATGKRGLPSAQVVVTNPTHFAVALYYEPGVVELPVVVAKGQDAEALRIRREAGRRAIPVLESPPLARSLFSGVALGEYIGDEHVEAVAEVFRWLGKLKGQGSESAGGATVPGDAGPA